MKHEVWIIEGEAYEVDVARPLGAGAYGTVYRASTGSQESVAIKRIFEAMLFKGLDRELEVTKGLVGHTYSNIVRVIAAGPLENDGAVVMELASGSLDARLVSGGLPESDALTVLLDLAVGLKQLHHHGVIHRDLKPQNVLTTPSGSKITDFGFGRLVHNATETVTFRDKGTAAYKAPEQWLNAPSTIQTDLYALGCIGYALLTGEPPFTAADPSDLRNQHLNVIPDPVQSVSDQRTSVLLTRMLSKDVRARPQDAREVIERLNAIGQSVSGPSNVLDAIASKFQAETEMRAAAAREAAQTEQREGALLTAAFDALHDVFDDLEALVRNHLSNVRRPLRDEVHADGFKVDAWPSTVSFDARTPGQQGHIGAICTVHAELNGCRHLNLLNLAYIRETDRYVWNAYRMNHHAGPFGGPSHSLRLTPGAAPRGIEPAEWRTEIAQGRGPLVDSPLDVGYQIRGERFSAEQVMSVLSDLVAES